MLHALIVFASTEGGESSKTLFYIAGALLAICAVVISLIGIRGIGSFPAGRAQVRGVIGIAAVLVLFTAASAIITA